MRFGGIVFQRALFGNADAIMAGKINKDYSEPSRAAFFPASKHFSPVCVLL